MQKITTKEKNQFSTTKKYYNLESLKIKFKVFFLTKTEHSLTPAIILIIYFDRQKIPKIKFLQFRIIEFDHINF